MTTDIPQTTIDELRRLSAAATPAPWQSVREFINDSHHMNICRVNETVSFRSSGKSVSDGPESRGPNQELIIALRNNIDALLAELRRLQANERRYLRFKQHVRYVPASNFNSGFPSEAEACCIPAHWQIENFHEDGPDLDAAIDKLDAATGE